MYTKRYNLKHFTTITLGDSDIKKLLLKFKELAEKTRELEKQSFINRWMKKNRTTKEKAEQKYYERVYNLYDQEHYYRWLYGKDLSKKKRIQIMFHFKCWLSHYRNVKTTSSSFDGADKNNIRNENREISSKNAVEKYYKEHVENKGRNGLVGHIKIQKLKTEDRNFLMIFLL